MTEEMKNVTPETAEAPGSCGALNREAGVEFWMCFPKNPVV